MDLERCRSEDVDAVTDFLAAVDLTLSGLDAPTVRLWIERDPAGAVTGSTGYELSADGRHALIRSVAVRPEARSRGRGSDLARFALSRAAEEGASRAWLFSRRSGPFWQRLGFAPAERDELAAALADTHQVRLFRNTGQLEREVAWTRALTPADAETPSQNVAASSADGDGSSGRNLSAARSVSSDSASLRARPTACATARG